MSIPINIIREWEAAKTDKLFQICKSCNIEKPITRFSKLDSGNYRKDCNQCRNKSQKGSDRKRYDRSDKKKTCCQCLEEKESLEFSSNIRHTDGLESSCRKCVSYRKNHQYKERTRNYQLNKWYGISTEDYNKLLLEQNNRCKICDEYATKRLHVDHDRLTNRVRGLLCSNCNSMLGMAKDSEKTLIEAINYLKDNN